MAVFSFVIEMADKVTGPSAKAKKSMADLADQSKLLQGRMKGLEQQAFMAKTLGQTDKLKGLTAKWDSMNASLSEVKGKQAAVGSSSAGLQAEMAELSGGLSIVAEAAGAATLAFGAVVVAGAAMAIEAAEAREKMKSLFDALGNGNISGEQTIEMLDKMSDKIGLTRKQLAPMAQQLMAMGITQGPALEKALLANASALALMGDQGAAAFQKVMGQTQLFLAEAGKMKNPLKAFKSMGLGQGEDVAAAMGVSVKTLAQQIKGGTVDAKKFGDAIQDALIKKGAGPLGRMGASLGNVWGKFTENITKMFEGIDVGPFLDEVKKLFSIFDQANPSGKALKSGIGAFFTQVFATATKVVPMVKHFLLDVIIFGLKAYISLKPMAKWFMDLKNNQSVMLVAGKLFTVLKMAAIGIGIAIAVVVVVFVALWAIMVGIGLAIWAVIGAIAALSVSIMETLVGWVSKAVDFGADFIDGLVNGITGSASKVLGAVKGIADGAKNAFKSALGISSPSKEMMKLGGFTGQGFAEGMNSAVPDVHAASSNLSGAAMALPGGAPGGAASSSSSSGGLQVTATINFNGAVQGAQELTEQAVSLIFERIALQQGV